MACLSAETISAMLAGGLSAQEKGELDEHISQCAECRRLLAETARWITGTVLVVDGGYTAQ